MKAKSIVFKLWIAIVSLLIISLALTGAGIFKIINKFYYDEITRNLTYQGEQIAAYYVNDPARYQDDEEITRFSHIINAYIIFLDENGIVQTCNAGTHLSPGAVFKETELSEIFQGKVLTKSDYYAHFNAEMLTVGIPVKQNGQVTDALLIYTPIEPISATLDSLKILLISILLGLVILASVLALVLSRTLSKPLLRMNHVALGLAQGDFSQRVTVNSSDEVGVLGTSLNYLSEQLHINITALSVEKEKVESILRGMSDGVITIDTSGNIILINPPAEKLLRYPILQIGNALKGHKELGQLMELAEQVLKTKEDTRGEIKIGEQTLAVRVSPLFHYEGNTIIGLIMVLQDITKERKLEEMRREFIANVSHELRTPVTLIQGYSEALIDLEGSPEQKESFVRTIIDEAHRLKRLVEELLELSRIEAGAITLDREEIDIGQMAQELKGKFEVSLQQIGIEFTPEIGQDAEWVWADKFRLEQILRNLIHNSLRYAAGGTITLSSRKTQDGIEIAIRDTGSGIDPEDLPFVFTRFYRADKSRNRESGGTGLGLAIVKSLVEAHGGTIQVKSIPNVSTEFIMTFPTEHE